MFYKGTTENLDWYRIEARNLDYNKLYLFYTDVGSNVLTKPDRIGQIVLTRESDRIYLYFTSYASEDVTKNNLDLDIKTHSGTHPLENWVSNYTATTAYQLSRERNTDECTYLGVSIENNAVLPQLISKLEKHNTPKLVSITIRFDHIRGKNSNSHNDDEPSSFYFCRPTEISSNEDSSSLLTKFESLNAGAHSYEVNDCSLESAVKSIYHGKIEYRDTKSVLLADNDLKYILHNK